MLNFTTSHLTVKPADHNSQKSRPKICALSLYNHVIKPALPGKVHDLTKREVGQRIRGKLALSHDVDGKCKQV